MLYNINPLYLHCVFHGIRFKVSNEDSKPFSFPLKINEKSPVILVINGKDYRDKSNARPLSIFLINRILAKKSYFSFYFLWLFQ